MRLQWYCGMQTEPDYLDGGPGPECDGEGHYDLQSYQVEDWEQGLSPCIQCHKCEQILEDPSHYTKLADIEPDPWLAPPGWEPPLPDDVFEEGDHVLFEGGVWRVVKETKDEFDAREQKLDIEYVAGPRMSRVIYATGIRSSDLKLLTDMEVVAYASSAQDE